MKQIPLTQGQFALVDDEDFDELNQFKWHALKCKNGFYAARRTSRKIGKTQYAYDKVAKQYFGEYAFFNFPQGVR